MRVTPCLLKELASCSKIALALLALSILAFAFSFYRLLRRRARYLEAMREGQ